MPLRSCDQRDPACGFCSDSNSILLLGRLAICEILDFIFLLGTDNYRIDRLISLTDHATTALTVWHVVAHGEVERRWRDGMFGRSRPGVHPTHSGKISGVQVMELERGWGGETGEREDVGRAEARRHSHASSAGVGVWLGPAGEMQAPD
jgi:hypothetical protein